MTTASIYDRLIKTKGKTMETFIIVAMLYFLITGILMIGMTVVGELPKSRAAYVPPPTWWYYVNGVVFILLAFWAAVVL